MVQIYANSSYSSTSNMYAYISSTPDLSDIDEYEIGSSKQIVPIEYNVEMGTVPLPVADSTGHENMKFAGWAENETADRIMEIRPEMVDTVAQWQNGELWQLYSQWTERTWAAYKSGIRDFTAFENTAQVTIRGNETVSLRFTSENMPAEALSFKFANGLTAGTILTLIDRSGDIPAYYTYTVDAETTELSSTVFTKMGEATTHFGGFSTDVVLQICYQNKILLDTETETVSIFAGDVVSEVDVVYDVELYISQELPDGNGSTEFEYSDTHSFNISGISLDGVNLPQNYRVFLRVRWDNLDLAPGTVITFLGTPATIYGGKYAILDTGATVQEVTGEIGGTIEIKLPTMVQNEFQDKTFYYELCIAPDLDNAFGEGVWTVLSMADVLTLKETPSLEVGSVDIEASMGGQLSVTVSSPDAEIYLYQQNSDGTFLYNANCATVFDGLTIDENGKLSIADGTLITDGVFSAAVSDNALRGKYYLVVKLGDKYERILLRIVNAPQETPEEPTQETT